MGPHAALIDVPHGTAPAWRQAVLDLVVAGRLPPPVDVVPGYSSVLVDGVPAAELGRALDGVVVSAGGGQPSGEVVTLPVMYDGPDLDAVARAWDTDPAGVVRRHVEREYVVAFCGFAPGFGYLTPAEESDVLPPVPRLAQPRQRVAAGSVGLAGPFTGVYPRESPAGWQVVGRSDAVLFDLAADPPALLAPGTRVRFSAVDELATAGPVPTTQEAVGSGHGTLTVTRAGLLTTVQDRGRPGLAHLGVPRSGALDATAAEVANLLVGNEISDAVLETTLDGVAFGLDRVATIAVTGAQATVTVDGREVACRASVEVPAGAEVDVGRATAGVRSYVALSGGVAVPLALGSRSTDTLSGLGPPRLVTGMRLPLGEHRPRHATVAPAAEVRPPAGDVVLRVVPGPDLPILIDGAFDALLQTTYVVSPSGDRVGVRLDGFPLRWRAVGEVDSAGMVLGAVQVPSSGLPTVLLADHPATGGYPVAAVVDPRDLGVLAQARPGTIVHMRREGR